MAKQGRRGLGCELLTGEDPIDPSEWIAEDAPIEMTKTRRSVPGVGSFFVMLEKPNKAQYRISRHKTADEARIECERLNFVLSCDSPVFGRSFAFCFVASLREKLPWVPGFVDTGARRGRKKQDKPVEDEKGRDLLAWGNYESE
jgi:hypothetical protein